MAWTEAQKKYANSSKGKEARRRYQQSEKGRTARAAYMARRKAKSVHEKELNASTNDPKTKPELAKMSKEAAENPEV